MDPSVSIGSSRLVVSDHTSTDDLHVLLDANTYDLDGLVVSKSMGITFIAAALHFDARV